MPSFYNIFLSKQDLDFEINLLNPSLIPAKGSQRFQTLRSLSYRVSSILKTIAVPYLSGSEALIAVPSSVTLQRPFKIKLTSIHEISHHKKSLKLDLTDRHHKIILKDFLHQGARKLLWQHKELWGDSATTFFPVKPSQILKDTEVCHGFMFRLEVLQDGKIALVLDLTTSFTDAKSILDYREESRWEEFLSKLSEDPQRENKFLLDYEAVKYKVYFDSLGEKSISQAEFEKDGKEYDVYDYIHEKYPWLQNKVRKDEPVALIKYQKGDAAVQQAAPSLLRLVYNTEQLSDDVYQKCILETKDRVEKTKSFLKYFQNLSIGNKTISFSNEYLSGKVVKGGRFDMPKLAFGGGKIVWTRKGKDIHFVPFEKWGYAKKIGLSEYGPYRKADLRNQLLLYPQALEKKKVDAFQNDFLEVASAVQKISEFKLLPYEDPVSISKHVRENTNSSFQLIILPGSETEEYEVFKTELTKSGIQFISQHNILHFNPPKYVRDEDHKRKIENKYRNKLFTAFLGLIGKSNGMPWVLGEDLHHDCYIGVDVGGRESRIASYSYVFDKRGCYLGAGKGEAQKGEQISSGKFKWAIIKAINQFKESNPEFSPSSVVIHRDGDLQREERIGLEEATDYLVDKGILKDTISVAVVQAKKSYHPYRIFNDRRGEIINPAMGDHFIIDDNTALLATTGRPTLSQGTAKPLLIELETIKGDFDIVKIIQDVFYLSELNWGSPLLSIKLPITIKYADAISSLISKGIEPTTLPL
jgi:hypothetical protein